MTVSAQSPYVQYDANGVANSFAYPFQIKDEETLYVYVNTVLVTTGYSATGIGNPGGGAIVFDFPPALGDVVFIARILDFTQPVVLSPYTAFPAQTVEEQMDLAVMMIQQLQARAGNSVELQIQEIADGFNMLLPFAATRANQLLGFDIHGNVTVYPQTATPSPGVTDHGLLTGLADNDHPQYRLVIDADAAYVAKTGSTMTGALLLSGDPTQPTQAASKNYVDNFTGSITTQNVTSNVVGDAQATVDAGWNAQANAAGIFRAANAIIYYTWKSTGGLIYRYVGSQQGPAGWASTPADWVQSSGVAEAPTDGQAYARKSLNWVATIEKTGGTLTGQLTLAGGGTGLQAIAVSEAAALDTSLLSGHVAAADPHTQYILKTQKAAVNGVASLDGTGKVPAAQLPPGGSIQQDTPPAWQKGVLWFDSNKGTFALAYENPDLTQTLVAVNGFGAQLPKLRTRLTIKSNPAGSSGTHIWIAELQYAKLWVIGGGGGGGNSDPNNGGSGGGGGGSAYSLINAEDAGASFNWIQGAFGGAQQAGGNSSATGVFGTLATGGGGAGATDGEGGTSGSASGGQINVLGCRGGGVTGTGVSNNIGGDGGAAPHPWGAPTLSQGVTVAGGRNSVCPGSGGSGATQANAVGGSGSAGAIIIEEYYYA